VSVDRIPGSRAAPRCSTISAVGEPMTHDEDPATQTRYAQPRAVRRVARICLITTTALAFLGIVVANSVGDQEPPYEPSLISDVAWTLFLACGAASVILGALFFVWLIRDENHVERALRGKVAEVAELRASRGRLVDESDAIRRRIERDLHDGVQARLVALLLNVRLARRAAGADHDGVVLEQVEDELESILGEVRAVARGVLPPALTDLGLEAAVTELTARMPFRVDLAIPSRRLPERIEVTAYFLIAESLTNAAKHARASHVTVNLSVSDRRVLVDVDDDGVGGAKATAGSGLQGLADRVDAVGGRLAVTSRHGVGTHVHAELPCES
jgi:signal transduction histidine kinase